MQTKFRELMSRLEYISPTHGSPPGSNKSELSETARTLLNLEEANRRLRSGLRSAAIEIQLTGAITDEDRNRMLEIILAAIS